jgi:hypothetical protein
MLAPERPAEAAVIQDSVTAILDADSGIHTGPIELVILPLFIAGADCISRHSRHYVILRLDGISAISGFSTELPKMLLRQVWDARSRQAKRECENILWTAFVSRSASLPGSFWLCLVADGFQDRYDGERLSERLSYYMSGTRLGTFRFRTFDHSACKGDPRARIGPGRILICCTVQILLERYLCTRFSASRVDPGDATNHCSALNLSKPCIDMSSIT